MSGCIYPTAYDNNDVMAAYTKWKADLVTSEAGAGGFQRVQRTSSDGLGSERRDARSTRPSPRGSATGC